MEPFLMEKYKAYLSWSLEGLALDPNAAPEAAHAASEPIVLSSAPARVVDMQARVVRFPDH
jgi:hypothetical protein